MKNFSFIQRNLQIKYSNKTKNLLNEQIINGFISYKHFKMNIILKENIFYNDFKEYLKKLYFSKEIKKCFNKLINYYKNYSLYFCKPTFADLNLGKIIRNLYDKKAEIYYKNNYLKNKKNNLKNNNFDYKIFTKSIHKDIINFSLDTIINEKDKNFFEKNKNKYFYINNIHEKNFFNEEDSFLPILKELNIDIKNKNNNINYNENNKIIKKHRKKISMPLHNYVSTNKIYLFCKPLNSNRNLNENKKSHLKLLTNDYYENKENINNYNVNYNENHKCQETKIIKYKINSKQLNSNRNLKYNKNKIKSNSKNIHSIQINGPFMTYSTENKKINNYNKNKTNYNTNQVNKNYNDNYNILSKIKTSKKFKLYLKTDNLSKKLQY